MGQGSHVSPRGPTTSADVTVSPRNHEPDRPLKNFLSRAQSSPTDKASIRVGEWPPRRLRRPRTTDDPSSSRRRSTSRRGRSTSVTRALVVNLARCPVAELGARARTPQISTRPAQQAHHRPPAARPAAQLVRSAAARARTAPVRADILRLRGVVARRRTRHRGSGPDGILPRRARAGACGDAPLPRSPSAAGHVPLEAIAHRSFSSARPSRRYGAHRAVCPEACPAHRGDVEGETTRAPRLCLDNVHGHLLRRSVDKGAAGRRRSVLLASLQDSGPRL